MDLEIGVNTRNLMNSTEDMDYRRSFVNATLNFLVPYYMELVIRSILMFWHMLIFGMLAACLVPEALSSVDSEVEKYRIDLIEVQQVEGRL